MEGVIIHTYINLVIILILVISGDFAVGSCKYKENCHCVVPGSTLKWHLAYCSYKTENEDLESEVVRKCMATSFAPGGDNCKQNEHWKFEMCKVFHKTNRKKEEACKRKFFIPKLVGF